MSIADKIRNIYLEKKNLKRVLKDVGSDIDENTLFADYPSKIDEAYSQKKFYDEEYLAFIRTYYELRRKNHAWVGSTIDVIDLTPYPFIDIDLYSYFSCSNTSKIILPIQDAEINTLDNVFGTCKYLKEIENLKDLNVTSVTSTLNCFNGCESLESLDISTWELRFVTDATDMFKDCINLKELDARNLSLINDLDSVLFTNVRNLRTLRLDNCITNTTVYLIEHLYNDNYETGAVSPCTIYINQTAEERVRALNLPFTYVVV